MAAAAQALGPSCTAFPRAELESEQLDVLKPQLCGKLPSQVVSQPAVPFAVFFIAGQLQGVVKENFYKTFSFFMSVPNKNL